MKLELNKIELEYIINILTKEIERMQDSNVAFENGYIDKLYSKLIVLTKTK